MEKYTKEFFQKSGRVGGKAGRGKNKIRGDSKYYRKIAKKSGRIRQIKKFFIEGFVCEIIIWDNSKIIEKTKSTDFHTWKELHDFLKGKDFTLEY